MTIRNAVETRLTETIELYELEQANPHFPDTLTHEYFYGKCMGIIDMALSLGMDEDEVAELYEPFRLRLLALHSTSDEVEGDELEAHEGEGISFDVEELADLHVWCDIWYEGGEWHAELYGSDIETHHYVGESFKDCEQWVERKTAELLEDWEATQWGNEEYTIEDEIADREFEAARERRYGYDD